MLRGRRATLATPGSKVLLALPVLLGTRVRRVSRASRVASVLLEPLGRRGLPVLSVPRELPVLPVLRGVAGNTGDTGQGWGSATLSEGPLAVAGAPDQANSAVLALTIPVPRVVVVQGAVPATGATVTNLLTGNSVTLATGDVVHVIP